MGYGSASRSATVTDSAKEAMESWRMAGSYGAKQLPSRCQRPTARVRRGATQHLDSEVVGVLAELPVGDEPLEALDLVPLVGQKRADEVLAEHPGKLAVGRQGVQRVAEPLWQRFGPRWVVTVALQLGGRLNLAGDAQVDGCADGRHGQVWIGGGIAEPHL